jgi:Domain of unknown function (DUF4432)
MAEQQTSRRGPWNAVELSSSELTVTLLPEKGCDVLDLIHRESGVDVLLKTPWTPGRRPIHAPSSLEAWLEAYPGGWQLILPNGGDSTVEHGVEWGFHGDAALVPWEIEELGPSRAIFSTTLLTAPLDLRRVVTVEGPELRVEEEVRNGSEDPLEVMWGHHPALGAPFLAPGCTIAVSARTFRSDDRAPGTGLAPGAVSEWPYAELESGGTIDLSIIPPAEERRAVLGYLTDFEEGRYRIESPRSGLAVELEWPLEVFPVAWFWQELHASPDYPWYRRLYTTALEPNTSWPGQGIASVREKGGSTLRLEGGETRTVTVAARVRRTKG